MDPIQQAQQANQPTPQQSPIIAPDQDPRYVQIASRLGLDYDQVAKMAHLPQIQQMMAQLDEEMAYANYLRTAEGPQGRNVRGMFVAANPMEFAAQALRAHYGGKEARRVNEEREKVRERERDALVSATASELNLRGEEMDFLKSYLRRGAEAGAQAARDEAGGGAAPPAAAPVGALGAPEGLRMQQYPPPPPSMMGPPAPPTGASAAPQQYPPAPPSMMGPLTRKPALTNTGAFHPGGVSTQYRNWRAQPRAGGEPAAPAPPAPERDFSERLRNYGLWRTPRNNTPWLGQRGRG